MSLPMSEAEELRLRKQASIDHEVASAIIGATPEHWNSAAMHVERDESGGQERMSVVISSPEGHPEPIRPPDAVFEALAKLLELFRSSGEACWWSVHYEVALDATKQWKYTVRFTY